MYVICVQRIQFFLLLLLFVLTLTMIALGLFERACLPFFLDGSSFFFFFRLPTSKTNSNIVQF